MTHKIGDRASCGECGRILVYTSDGWKHAGLNQPRHMAIPVAAPMPDPDDLAGDSGVTLPYHDAPEDEAINHAAAAHALGKLTEQISGILMLRGRHPDLCERDMQLIRHVLTSALGAVSDA